MREYIKIIVITSLVTAIITSSTVYAGGRFIISNIHQIKPNVIQEIERKTRQELIFQGPAGPVGREGVPGLNIITSKPEYGPTGQRGYTGFSGERGSTGVQGTTGPTGPNFGPTGPTGPNGAFRGKITEYKSEILTKNESTTITSGCHPTETLISGGGNTNIGYIEKSAPNNGVWEVRGKKNEVGEMIVIAYSLCES